MEIERLHKMLTDAGIEHEWLNRNPKGYPKDEIDFGWHIVVYREDGERLISAIEGFGTYGYGGWSHGLLGGGVEDGDLIEIMGCLTPEEEEYDSVVGYLTAENVFNRIIKALGGNKDEVITF